MLSIFDISGNYSAMKQILTFLYLTFSLASCESTKDEIDDLAHKYVEVINSEAMQAKSDIKWEFIPVAFNYLRSENGNYTAEIPGIGITKRDMDTTSTTLTLEIKKFEEGWRITEAAFAYDVHGTIQKTQIMSLYSVGMQQLENILSSKENNGQGSNNDPVGQSDTSIRIVLPRGFVCTPESNPASQLFSDGRYTFSIYSWGHEGVEEDQLVKTVEQSYEHQIKFKKTATGMYWGTGKVEDMYYYIILIPEKLYQIQVFSKYNDEKFSYYSTWLYNQISNAKDKEFYLVDHNRRSCSSN